MNASLTMLVVEDEPVICLAMEQALQSGGFEVVAAPSGAAALALLLKSKTQFAGLITDIRLGDGIDGWKLARQARVHLPDISVIYITGDSAADWPAQGVPGSLIMQKPVADGQLLTEISTLLSERGCLS